MKELFVYSKKEAKAEHYTEHSQLLTATGQQPAVLTHSETRTVTRVQRCWDAAHQGWGPSVHGAAEAFGDTWEVLLRDEASWVPHGWVEPQLATGEALAHHCCSSFFIFIASSGSCHVLLTVTGPITQDLQLVVFCAAHHIFRMAYRLLYESDCYNHHSR